MRIVVCVKHVPDVQGERAFTSDGLVDRSRGDGTLNELDENAVEAAVSLVEEHGGEVVVLTMGPADAEDAVRRGLQMGADQAVHVHDDALAGSDSMVTAEILAAAVRHIAQDGQVDLVVTGMAALDGLMSVVPTLLAAHLELPRATLAARLAVADGQVTITRELDHATEELTAPLPALVSVTDQTNQPRYPNFKAIMAARKKPVTALSLADLGVDPSRAGAAGSRTRVLAAEPRPARENRVLITDEGDAGLRLAQFLVDNRLV
ncbi:electron transfer flavoprotein subunit beta/FixA family protein [Cellulomonas bogoriensis]|uniref:Electron transfer flavoprotein subunit beta n=1 Tax=Cellulomonas bogoriensis 69B4 = DSM 16987 TaxID=1386082 RepID=A0A0A0C067_9CELL|nr:electron transfer flavoprotein subunit beta/FixA family protein [Cellulomonas bogoriensis]KGM13585.1 electron transfer flavoprotein subunit beta [Cellulomonas bogoriensis 69B4 = DSM 16987]